MDNQNDAYAVEIVKGIEINTNKPYLMPFQILMKILKNKNRTWYLRHTIAKVENLETAVEIYKANIFTCKTVKWKNKIIADLLYIRDVKNDENDTNYELVKEGRFQPLFTHVSMVDGYGISSNGRPVKFSDARRFMNDELLDSMKNEFEYASYQDFFTEYENIYRRKYKSEFVEDYELELEIFKKY